MGSKGSNTTTTSTAPNPAAMMAYQNLMGGAQGVVNQNPFQNYSGEFVSPINEQQYGGIGGINKYAESAQPAIGAAERLALMGAAPITSGDIQGYYNPWQQQVVAATEAQFGKTNEEQQQQVLGNAALQGALGGDRTAVAQANLASGQQLAQAPVIAGLESQGFNQAAQLALAAKQQQAQGAYSLGNLGVAGQQAGLTGAGAQIQAGTLEQQNKQQLDAALYNQFLMQQAFPYQQMQWLAGIDTGVGSQMGGTSQTTAPPPNLLSQLGGLGLTAAAFLAHRGGAVDAEKGEDGVYHVPGFADGGVPALIGQPLYGGISGFLPQVQLTRGIGAPKPPTAGSTTSGADKMIQDAQKLAGIMRGRGSGDNGTSGAPMDLSAPPAGDIQPIGMAPEGGFGAGPVYAKGGLVDRLPRHNRINVPTRAGFGLGSFLPHRQEGGEVVELPPDQVPKDVPPEAMEAWRTARDLDLPPQITGGVTGAAPTGEALPFTDTTPPRAGLSDSPVTDAILSRFRAGNRPVPASPEHGIGGLNLMGANLSPRTRESLMAAGLGMLASRSPFALSAIGEGGLQGLSTYQQIGKEQRAEAMSQQKINQAADNLALHAEQAQKTLALHTKQFEETKRQHGEPFGWTRNADGTVTPTAGGPHDPEQVRREAEAKGEMWAPMLTPEGNYVLMNKRTGEVKTPQGLLVPQPQSSAPPAPGATPPATVASDDPARAPPGSPIRLASADPNIVGIVRANAAQAAEPYNYNRDAPYIEKGMQVPEPAPTAGKSVQTIKTDAESYLQTGKLPPVARGNSPVAVQQNNYRNAVQNYGNALASSRGMTPEQVAEAWRTAPGMLRFVLGPDGRSTVALGTAVRHLDTLKQYADAWAANDIQTVNRLRAVISREFGNEAATNLQAAGRIVGPEIIKAIGVAGAGTADERAGATSAFSTAASPQQMQGAIVTTQKLLGGQLEGRQRQAANAGVSPERFRSLVGDRPYEILTNIDRGGGGGTGTAAHPTPSEADIAYARAHPEVRDKFKARFGREP